MTTPSRSQGWKQAAISASEATDPMAIAIGQTAVGRTPSGRQ